MANSPKRRQSLKAASSDAIGLRARAGGDDPGRQSEGRAAGETTLRPRSEGRLSRDNWIKAGQCILRADGISAVKLSTLTRKLGVSTGSFYHHFTDFEDYLSALAESYSIDSVQGVLDRTSFDHPDPLTRVRKLARLSVAEGTFELDRAMRIWATMDPRAEVTVRRAEKAVLAFLSEAFRDLGFGDKDAFLRARMLMSVNVAPLSILEPAERRQFFKDCLRLLSGRDD